MFAYLWRSSIGGLLLFSVYAGSRPLNLAFKSNGPIDFELGVHYSVNIFCGIILVSKFGKNQTRISYKTPHIRVKIKTIQRPRF